MKINSTLAARLARQIAEQTGVEVRCGNAVAVLSHDERENFRV